MIRTAPHLFFARRLRFEAGWRARVHRHFQGEELLLITGGSMRCAAEKGESRIGPGMFTGYAPGEEHHEWNDGKEPVTLLALLWSGGEGPAGPGTASGGMGDGSPEEARNESPSPGLPPFSGQDRSGRIRCAAEWLADLDAEGISGREPLVEGLLWGLKAESGREPQPPPDPRIAAARAFLADHLGETLEVGALARRAGMSLFHFSRIFAAQVGEPPSAHIRRLRVERARALILESRLSLDRIAGATGLRDGEGLRRAFLAVTGTLPSALRRD